MDCKAIFEMADKAGKEAVESLQVRPMVVSQHTNPMDDSSPVARSWFVEEGCCGFADVHIKPATSKFARWMVTNGYARKDSYRGGITYWISDYNQSMQKKEAYAIAFSKILNENGITSYASSRMD